MIAEAVSRVRSDGLEGVLKSAKVVMGSNLSTEEEAS